MADHMAQVTITVTSQTTFNQDPDVTCGFEPDEWLFWHSGTGGDIDYSFDGQTIHGTLVLGEPVEAMGETSNERRVWFKRAAAGAGTATVRVQASRAR